MNYLSIPRRKISPAGLCFCGWTAWMLAASISAQAEEFAGRAAVGGFTAHASMKNNPDGSYANDFATTSSRIFTRIWDLSSQRLELIFDIRDKHDFYDKLDSERLSLTGRNTLQARQLNIRRTNPENSWLFSLGRFSVPDAGAVNVDGLDTGFRWNEGWRTSFFGGFDPKLPEQSWYQWNPDAYVFGTYTAYQPLITAANRSASGSMAFVGKQVNNHLDRLYLYNSFLYEWNTPSRVLGMLYVDFKPQTYVQTGLLSYTQKLNKKWQSNLQGSVIDILEYSRRKGVLETLPANPYREASASLRQDFGKGVFMDYSLLYGERTLDRKQSQEASLGPTVMGFLDDELTASLKAGYRKNFTSDDYFAKFNLGYYPKSWEISWDQYLALQKEDRVYHPLISEFSIAHFFSRDLHSMLSFQLANSELSSVTSIFIYIGYRFGSGRTASQRAGLPPRGRI